MCSDRMRRWAIHAVVIAFGGMLEAASANAEERPRGLASFEWSRAPGAEGCLSDAAIVEDVERSLKRRVFAPRAVADRVLRASIAPAASGWHATIDLSTKRGVALGARELELEGNDCREASDALVLAISLMADLPELSVEREPPPPVEAPVHFRAAIAPAAVVDDRPAVHPGADLSLEIVPRAFVPIVVDVVLQLQTRGTTQRQRYWLAGSTFAVSLCPLHVARSRFGLLACAGPEATVYAAWGRGFPEEATAFSSTFGGLAQARASYAFADRLRGFLFLGAIATPQRAGVVFTEVGGTERVLGRTSHVLGVGGLGVTLEL
jgi:hypothetical protein